MFCFVLFCFVYSRTCTVSFVPVSACSCLAFWSAQGQPQPEPWWGCCASFPRWSARLRCEAEPLPEAIAAVAEAVAVAAAVAVVVAVAVAVAVAVVFATIL